jgi:hypothetical protein
MCTQQRQCLSVPRSASGHQLLYGRRDNFEPIPANGSHKTGILCSLPCSLFCSLALNQAKPFDIIFNKVNEGWFQVLREARLLIYHKQDWHTPLPWWTSPTLPLLKLRRKINPGDPPLSLTSSHQEIEGISKGSSSRQEG